MYHLIKGLYIWFSIIWMIVLISAISYAMNELTWNWHFKSKSSTLWQEYGDHRIMSHVNSSAMKHPSHSSNKAPFHYQILLISKQIPCSEGVISTIRTLSIMFWLIWRMFEFHFYGWAKKANQNNDEKLENLQEQLKMWFTSVAPEGSLLLQYQLDQV